jgi:hypothetical protein
MRRKMNRTIGADDLYDNLKRENDRLLRLLTGERARIKRAIGMLTTMNSMINDDEEDDELLRAIVDLFEDYDIP